MKPIRTTIFALCLATVSYASQAQTAPDQPTPPPPHDWHGPHGPPGLDIDRLTVLLDLDPYQAQQVQPAHGPRRKRCRLAARRRSKI